MITVFIRYWLKWFEICENVCLKATRCRIATHLLLLYYLELAHFEMMQKRNPKIIIKIRIKKRKKEQLRKRNEDVKKKKEEKTYTPN